ncbi:hypothetical protein [Sphingomonas sp.]|jgi:hypothetical protein|uniref:hypothetical protein n=1 Tax=Sphingomonas sp. TaxID=28214 RepID=UPI002E2FF1CF|nr:hypothetical protein [Sphingomonas sp.]HEX4695805.1 hypothetical protein [Sphingomonas sp.]
MIALAVMAAAIGGAPVVLTDRASIAVSGRAIRLRDVVAGRYALGAAGAIEIARIPAGAVRLTLSRRMIATIVRRMVPGLTVTGANAGTIEFRAPPIARRAPGNASDLPKPAIARGEAMTFAVRVGPVTVERPVAAMQPGRVGRRVFVRDTAGNVFSARLSETAR